MHANPVASSLHHYITRIPLFESTCLQAFLASITSWQQRHDKLLINQACRAPTIVKIGLPIVVIFFETVLFATYALKHLRKGDVQGTEFVESFLFNLFLFY